MTRIIYDKGAGEYYATGDSGQELFEFWRGYAMWGSVVNELLLVYGIEGATKWDI